MFQSIITLCMAWKVPIFGLAAGLVLVLYLSKVTLVLWLRSRHSAMWQQLGSPTPREIVFNPSGATAKGLWGWVWRRDYRGVGDPNVTLAGTCYRTAMIIFIPVAVLAIVVFATVETW
jgi:hypothetical protein